jgi:hypothetical protein
MLRSAAASTWVFAAVVAFLSLPGIDLHPEPGLDPSWGTGLTLAHLHGLDFGPDIIFTYGPLGFLAYPRLLTPAIALEGLLYVGAVQFAFCASLLAAARRMLPLLPAAVLVFLLARTLLLPPTTMYLPLVAFVCCAGVLREPSPARVRALALVGGAATAIVLLVAFYVGVFFLLVIAGTLVASSLGRSRNLGTFAAAFAVSELLLWFALGQSAGSFPTFVQRSLSISSGYSDAMGIEEAGRSWEYVAALIVVLALLGLAVASAGTLAAVRRAAVLVLTGFFAWFEFKHGFVRHDGHSMAFFASMAAAPLAFGVRAADRWRVLLASAIAFAAFFGASRASLGLLNPLPAARATLSEARTVIGSGRQAQIAADRERLRVAYALDPTTLGLVGGRTVHIWPYDAALAWGYPELSWRPLPVFQLYTAYTDLLDDADASFIRSDRAPERILRNLPVVIDGRFGALEAPDATLALLCRYVELHATPTWQVLARVPDRCGPPRLSSTVHTVSGAAVPVPRPREGEVVIARVHGLEPTFFERIGAMAWKLSQRTILLNRNPFRLVPDTADHSLIMNLRAGSDYSGVFALSPGATEVAFIRGPLSSHSHARIEISFYRVPIRGAGVVHPATG